MLTRTRNGRERRTASYRDATGHVRSAGTFVTKEEAPAAIRRPEVDPVTGTLPGRHVRFSLHAESCRDILTRDGGSGKRDMGVGVAENQTFGYAANPADLGAFLRAIREERELTQEDLAADLGITRQYLAELEAGKPTLYATRLFGVLRLLDIRLKLEATL
ncbi:MAG: helix-turn-helix domain-containing protein [Actinomycetales bacterium]|nr:helix-turn-helix domain-containing protein [Actinomycetales bacterium]